MSPSASGQQRIAPDLLAAHHICHPKPRVVRCPVMPVMPVMPSSFAQVQGTVSTLPTRGPQGMEQI